jgi:hypothetical protein
MLGIVAFVLAFIAEFVSEYWSIEASNAVTGRIPLNKTKMARRVRKATLWSTLLLGLGWVDVAGVFSGLPLAYVVPGSLVGGMAGTYFTMWKRWRDTHAKLRQAKEESKIAGSQPPEGGLSSAKD